MFDCFMKYSIVAQLVLVVVVVVVVAAAVVVVCSRSRSSSGATQLLEAICYKPESRRFDSRWFQLKF
jgi:hypothetical protein